MADEKKTQLEAVLKACRQLDAEVRYQPEYGHFTVMIREDGMAPADEQQARAIQEAIAEQSARFPRLVCYCFDPFSTMVYTI